MTYREMLEKMDVAVTDRNLYQLGHWLGNEGSRAKSFPDAEPIEEIESEWIVMIFETNLAWEEENEEEN